VSVFALNGAAGGGGDVHFLEASQVCVCGGCVCVCLSVCLCLCVRVCGGG